jgi:hypothetical protein
MSKKIKAIKKIKYKEKKNEGTKNFDSFYFCVFVDGD